MSEQKNKYLCTLLDHYPELASCQEDVMKVFGVLCECFHNGGKLLLCGNGGSAADCEHIVGELMKGFLLKRHVSEELAGDPSLGGTGRLLQGALPAISLTGQPALSGAIQNDIDAKMVFAQQVYGYGKPGDVLLGISTSGNAENVLQAARVGRAMGLHTVALTGENGGKLAPLCENAIKVPAKETYRIQEYHLPVYHTLCAMVEAAFFGDIDERENER